MNIAQQIFRWADYGTHDGSIFVGNTYIKSNQNQLRYANIHAIKGGETVGVFDNVEAASRELELAASSISKCLLRGISVKGYTFTADKKSA